MRFPTELDVARWWCRIRHTSPCSVPRRRRYDLPVTHASRLTCTRTPSDTGLTLRLRGEIDLSNVAWLQTELDGGLAESTGPLTIDLSGVDFCDSLGFSALIRSWRAATASGRQFVLARPTPPVRRILDLMGISTVIPIADEIPA